MKLSDAIARFILSKGIDTVFGFQGGAITHMIDSFDKYKIQYIQNYNEQGSSFAADAFSRICASGMGCAIGTNGPGATNLITGIANAYCDSIPVLFFTGQVHSFAMKGNASTRQESFQEIDIVSVVSPITKYAKTILNKDEALFEIEKAINIATSGRPGPVVIDIPVDIQGSEVEYIEPKTNSNISDSIDKKVILEALNDIYSSERPIIISGGGIRISKSTDLLREFVKKTGIPVTVSLMGIDSMPHDDENFIGFIGSYGNRYSNLAIQNADLILALGTRLDMRQTGKRKDLFGPKAKVIHIDVDDGEIRHFIKSESGIQADLNDFLKELTVCLDSEKLKKTEIDKWKKQIAIWKSENSDLEEIEYKGLHPNKVVNYFGNIISNNSIACADVGQNQMWVAQSLRIKGDNVRILNSGGLGAMGFSLPAAIGAYYASKESQIVAFMGDGGLQMNIQELQLVGSKQLPITVVVFNNHSLGLIRDVHEKYYEKRYVGSVWGFSLPDLEYICKAYNIEYCKVNNYNDLYNIKSFASSPKLVEVVFDEDTYVKPELLGNDSLDRQIPYKEA